MIGIIGEASVSDHLHWLNGSPAARASARHGIDWTTEAPVPLQISWVPDELEPDDVKIAPAVAHYGGEVGFDAVRGVRIVRFTAVPPVYADTLMWDQDEYCGWMVLE